MRVLLVDDEVELVSTLAERLAMRDIDADWVTSGAEAVEAVEQAVYDVVVLDVRLPGMSGLELSKKLEARRPTMKFIFLTGHASEDDFKRGQAAAGESFYLVKPIHIDVLIQKMTETLGKHEP